MTLFTQKIQYNQNEIAVAKQMFPDLKEKIFTDVDKAKTILVHFDHIIGEADCDREQIFSNLLKAASYFGLSLDKIDFHRQDA